MGFLGFGKKRKVADIYSGLRNQAFSLDPTKIGLKPDETNPIFGILLETGYKDAVITLSAIGDGAVSLYFSNGGGIIGLGEHEGPKKACLSFLSFDDRTGCHVIGAGTRLGNTEWLFREYPIPLFITHQVR